MMSAAEGEVDLKRIWADRCHFEELVQDASKNSYKIKIQCDDLSFPKTKLLAVQQIMQITENLGACHDEGPISKVFLSVQTWNLSNRDKKITACIDKLGMLGKDVLIKSVNEITASKSLFIRLHSGIQREYSVEIRAPIFIAGTELEKIKKLVDQGFGFRKTLTNFNFLRYLHEAAIKNKVTIQAQIIQENLRSEGEKKEAVSEFRIEVIPSEAPSATLDNPEVSLPEHVTYLQVPMPTGANAPKRTFETFRQIKVKFRDGSLRRYRLNLFENSQSSLKAKIEFYQKLVSGIKDNTSESRVLFEIDQENMRRGATIVDLTIVLQRSGCVPAIDCLRFSRGASDVVEGRCV